MTREFDKQRRDDARPSTRNYSSSRYGEERSPRPARPRLNRATVDRGWETGAQRNHADYRTRSRSNGNTGQPTRDYDRRGQQSDRPSAQNSRNPNGRRPYENRQDNYRYDDRSPYGNRRPSSRPNDSGRRNFDEQRYNERRGYSDRYQEGGPRRDYRENTRYSDSRPSYRDRDQGRGYQQRGPDRNNRQERDFDRDNRSPRGYDRNYGPDRGGSRRDTRNPRWQSRPQAQRGNYSQQPREYTNSSQEELFEGDYERFNSPDAPRHPLEHNREDEDNRGQVEERHVTRLPDGRVLKGPRQVQRKNEEFWTDVAQETDSLISEVHPATESEQASDSPATPSRKSRKQTPTGTPKARTRKASEVARGRKSRGKESAPNAKSSGPRPSQRGFKWPKP